MRVYLAGPNTQQQAQSLDDCPVLLSYAYYSKWMDRYHPDFSHILIDSGAYSEMNSGKKIDPKAYAEWSLQWIGAADAIAGLDDINGDWKKSLRNYEMMPPGDGFPTFHDTDPPELLNDLLPIAKENGGWIGIGLKPPREGKEKWLRKTLDRVPDGLHVHGWALRAYTHIRRLDSVDSTNWWRDAMALNKQIPWLNYGECCQLIVKRYQRWERVVRLPSKEVGLFDESASG